MQTLPKWLSWAVGGGAGAVTWAIVALLKKREGFLKLWSKLSKEEARIIVFAFAAILGGLLFWAQVGLGYVPAPESSAGWIEAMFSIVVSQVVYAMVKTSDKKRRQQGESAPDRALSER